MGNYDIFLGAENTAPKYENGKARFTAADASYVAEGVLLFTVELKALKKSESTLYLDVLKCLDTDFNNMYIDTNAATVENMNLISIQEHSRKTIRHRDGIVLHAFVEEDAFVR